MQLKIERKFKKSLYTIGKFFIENNYFCDTLELPVKDGEYGSAILPGNYRVIMSFSNRFQRVLPELLYVPNRTYIRIHSGNTVHDTDGCVLLGKNNELGKVNNSRFYSDKLNNVLLGLNEKIFIEII